MKILAAFFLTATIAFAAPAPDDDGLRAIAVSQAACDAFRMRDVAKFESLLLPDFTRTNTNSQVQTRGENVAEMRKRDPTFEIFQNEDAKARVHGDTAIVQGVTHFKGSYSGQSFDLRARFTDVLVRQAGEWKLASTHVTKIPQKP